MVSNRFVFNIYKEGFGFLSKIYHSSIQKGLWFLTEATIESIDPTVSNTIINKRRPNICTGTLSSQVDWSMYESRRTPRRVDNNGFYIGEASEEIKKALDFAENAKQCNGGISISIPANSLVDMEGIPPDDKVNVAISTVDIYDPNSMPGDYTVIIGDRKGYMLTYGAGIVSITSKGKKYQLKKGDKAKITIPINPLQLKLIKKPESSIPFLIYNEKQGTWRVYSEAKLDKDAYVAEIDHLSAFNMDLVKEDQACVKIDSTNINSDYDLEVSLSYGGDYIVRTYNIDNTPEKIHVIYNLPSNTDIALRAFSTGPLPTPITDTVTVNTGTPQNPSTPNCPDYPYNACNSQVILTANSLAPILYGPSTSTGDFTLSWDYTWTGMASTQNGFVLEESTISATSGFATIHTTEHTYDRRTHVEHSLVDKPTGSYWYRVKAILAGGSPSPYSNVVNVVVDTGSTTPTPTILRIINDLDDRVDGDGNDWSQLNTIIRVRVGTTIEDVLSGGELLYQGETTADAANLEQIEPNFNQDTNYQDFDISHIVPAADGSYCVFIQVGWWDAIFDPFTYEFLYWQKRNSMVLNCGGGCCVEKWVIVPIIQPYLDPELIRVSDYLPDRHWMGHPTCL